MTPIGTRRNRRQKGGPTSAPPASPLSLCFNVPLWPGLFVRLPLSLLSSDSLA